jgi:putative endonuclease
MKEYFVYILKCNDKSYYTGITNNLNLRLAQHQSGFDKESYTFSRRPIELVFYLSFNDVNQAISFEKQLKRWSRKKKEAVINGKWEELKNLAECKNATSHKFYNKK